MRQMVRVDQAELPVLFEIIGLNVLYNIPACFRLFKITHHSRMSCINQDRTPNLQKNIGTVSYDKDRDRIGNQESDINKIHRNHKI